MLGIEIIAVILTLLCVYLTTKRNVYAWPIGVAAVSFYAIVFFGAKLYADLCLQGFFAIQGIVGMFMWLRHREEKEKYIVKIGKLTGKERLLWIIPAIIIYFIIAHLFSTYTDAAVPYIDSLVAVLSLTANQLLVKRKIENWYIWITVNIIYIGLFIFKGLYVSSGLYLILLGLAIKGLYDWNKTLKTY